MKKQKINKISREKEQKSVGKGENKSKADSGRRRKTCQSRVKAKNEEEVVDGCGCLMYNK